MENAEYLKLKKKKKKRHRAVWIFIIVLLAVAAGIFFYRKQQDGPEENPNAEEAVVLEENQSWLYLEIDTIEGNEMQAAVVEKSGNEYIAAGDGEIKTYLIPVGTDVVTRLGSVTTFSRLAAGDVLHCLTEQADGEEVILKIWIEE